MEKQTSSIKFSEFVTYDAELKLWWFIIYYHHLFIIIMIYYHHHDNDDDLLPSSLFKNKIVYSHIKDFIE